MKLSTPLAVAGLLTSAVAHAQMSGSMKMPVTTNAPASSVPASAHRLTEGEVRKVDRAAGNVTLRHGPIDNLGMPGMTMVFKVADSKMLEAVKDGDKVRFRAERVDGSVQVTRIEPLK